MTLTPPNLPTSRVNAADAALSLFPLAKAYPKFVLKFAGVSAAWAVIQSFLVQISGLGRLILETQQILRDHPDDLIRVNTEVAAKVAESNPALVLPTLFVTLLAVVVLTTMGLRKTVRNEELPGLGIAFGRSEVAVLVANLVLTGIIIAATLALTLVLSILTVALPAAAAILLAFGMPLMMVFAVGRLGLWGVVTVANDRSSVREAMSINKNGFWGLVGAFFLWAVIGYIGLAIIGAIAQIIAGGLGTPTGAGVPGSLQEALQPGWMLYHAISGFAAAIVNLGFLCVGSFWWHNLGQGKAVNRLA
jgi:hypothetical protein